MAIRAKAISQATDARRTAPPLDGTWGRAEDDTARWSAEIRSPPRGEHMATLSRTCGNLVWHGVGCRRLHIMNCRLICLATAVLVVAVAVEGCSPGPAVRSPTAGPTQAPTPTASPAPLPGFTATGSMGTARTGATATRLPDGRVLIAGGFSTNAFGPAVASAELYDPKTGTFSPTGSMATPRWGATATLLHDGRVLIAGGTSGTLTSELPGFPGLASAELYDPKTGAFSPTGSMTTGRIEHTATLLADGRVLIAGSCGASAYSNTAELYNPSTGTFQRTGSMTARRCRQTATLLRDGSVLLAGGMDANENVLASAELYDPATGTFRATGSMSATRQTATALSDGRVLMVGALDGSTTSAELYDPASGTFSPTGSMTAPRENQTATLLADGRVLIAGGDNRLGLVASAELYDPKTGTFSSAGSGYSTRAGQTATLLTDGRVLIAGGSVANGSILASAQLYQP